MVVRRRLYLSIRCVDICEFKYNFMYGERFHQDRLTAIIIYISNKMELSHDEIRYSLRI